MDIKFNNMDIKEIRRTINKPFKFFGLSFSEFEFLLDSFVKLILIGFVAQLILNSIGFENISVVYYPLILFPFFILALKRASKKYDKGIIFFILKKTNIIKALFTNLDKKEKYRTIKSSKYYTNLQ